MHILLSYGGKVVIDYFLAIHITITTLAQIRANASIRNSSTLNSSSANYQF